MAAPIPLSTRFKLACQSKLGRDPLFSAVHSCRHPRDTWRFPITTWGYAQAQRTRDGQYTISETMIHRRWDPFALHSRYTHSVTSDTKPVCTPDGAVKLFTRDEVLQHFSEFDARMLRKVKATRDDTPALLKYQPTYA